MHSWIVWKGLESYKNASLFPNLSYLDRPVSGFCKRWKLGFEIASAKKKKKRKVLQAVMVFCKRDA